MTAGQAGDAPVFETVMAGVRVPRSGPGRPRTRPDAVLADRAYSSRAIRNHLRRRGIRAVIPSRPTRSATVCGEAAPAVAHRLSAPRRTKQCNAGERCINRLIQWRGLAMRTDKLAIAYQAALHLAAILIWARR
ncbi:transposase [Streptomyces flavofungini]|uniref:transposase n=1 Tax=Streptomyces flavofungini TaxID=68200 RepID=UPI0035714BDC